MLLESTSATSEFSPEAAILFTGPATHKSALTSSIKLSARRNLLSTNISLMQQDSIHSAVFLEAACSLGLASAESLVSIWMILQRKTLSQNIASEQNQLHVWSCHIIALKMLWLRLAYPCKMLAWDFWSQLIQGWDYSTSCAETTLRIVMLEEWETLAHWMIMLTPAKRILMQ